MSENKAAHFPVKWLITIVDRGRGEIAAELLNQIHKSFHMISLGNGTASSEIMDYLGLDEPEKDIVMSLIPQPLEKRLLQVLGEQMALSSPGKGIAFTISLDSISSAVCHHADPSHHMQTTTLKEADFAMSENKQFALIAAVIPHGESDLVVDATRAAGAWGHHDPRAGTGHRRGQPLFPHYHPAGKRGCFYHCTYVHQKGSHAVHLQPDPGKKR